jgi:hypothetical protein
MGKPPTSMSKKHRGRCGSFVTVMVTTACRNWKKEKKRANHVNYSASGHNIQLQLLCVRLCI